MKKPEFLKGVRRIHFVGIKGVGMTALACCAQDLKIKITGSDVAEVFVTDEVLKRRKIDWKVGFTPKHLTPRPNLVIATGAHGGLANPEVLETAKIGIPILTQAQALGKLMEGKDGISVCGVGGKTTTCSMIATVLETAHRKPSYAIGVAQINPLRYPGRYTEGREFVAEADEYVNSPGIDNRVKFLFQNPKVIVLTNIEFDHPDVYQDLEHTKRTFRRFFQKLPSDGLLIANADNHNNQDALREFKGNLQTYGFSPKSDWHIEKSYFGQGQTIFNLSHRKLLIEGVKIRVPGRFNVLNAAAAFAAGIFFGLDVEITKMGLFNFLGTKRRFEFIGEVNNIKLFDDYAHHPQEIREVISAAKKWYPQNRLIVIFQPHTYSRTKALFHEFTQAFSLAQVVTITDIYASARESDNLGMSARLLVEETKKYQAQVSYTPEKKLEEFLQNYLMPNDIILTLGAGSIFQWHSRILRFFKKFKRKA